MVDLIKKLKKHFDLVRDDKLNPFVRRKNKKINFYIKIII